MGTNKLRELRHNYKAVYTNYMTCVHALSIASLRGEWPTPNEILADESAFNALSRARRALFDELREYSERTRNTE